MGDFGVFGDFGLFVFGVFGVFGLFGDFVFGVFGDFGDFGVLVFGDFDFLPLGVFVFGDFADFGVFGDFGDFPFADFALRILFDGTPSKPPRDNAFSSVNTSSIAKQSTIASTAVIKFQILIFLKNSLGIEFLIPTPRPKLLN